MQLTLGIVATKEVDGVEMGVLSDGTAYLSGRGLAILCGVAPSAVINQATNWGDGKRDGKLAQMLLQAGFNEPLLYIPISNAQSPNGLLHAYPDTICAVVLEYYAFESNPTSARALANFRQLARGSLRQIIYGAIGYDPQKKIPEKWKQYHDRMLLNSAPKGYFSVFREISDIVLASIQLGLVVDAATVPDISVGQTWAKHWKDNKLDLKYGLRQEHPHVYPDYFPQAAANPVDAKVYPLGALGEFRSWMQSHYLPKVFPNYLTSKESKGALPAGVKDLILEAVELPELPPGENVP